MQVFYKDSAALSMLNRCAVPCPASHEVASHGLLIIRCIKICIDHNLNGSFLIDFFCPRMDIILQASLMDTLCRSIQSDFSFPPLILSIP